MAEIGTGKHSPVAMLLSVICPGLGQLYLRKIKKGVLIFLVAAMGAFIGVRRCYDDKSKARNDFCAGVIPFDKS